MTNSRIRLEILKSVEDIESRKSEWDACVKQSNADIYFTTDWLVPWWETYGGDRSFVGIIAWDTEENRMIGVLAFVIDNFGSLFSGFRLARLAGVDPNYAIIGLPVIAEYAETIWRGVFFELLGRLRCSAISISPISDSGNIQSFFLAALMGTTMVNIRDITHRNHTILPLPSKPGSLYAELSKGRQREYRRSRNRMERSYQLRQTMSSPNEVASDFEQFLMLHTHQWEAQGKGGHFSDWPGSAEFMRAVLLRMAPQQRGFIEKITGDGAVLASRLTFQLGDRVYWRLTARSLDPEVQSMGVARVALIDWGEAAIQRGGKLIEAGAGHYDHKLALGGQSIGLRSFVVTSKHTVRKTKRAIAVFNLIDLLYYRIWFLKIAPRIRSRLGLKPRPLWRMWRRTRL